MTDIIIFGSIIVLIAGFFQGLTGFGFSIIAVPFFLKIISLQEIVPILVILSICTNFLIFFDCFRKLQITKNWILVLFGVLFVPFGSYSLLYLNPDYLKLFFGIIVIIFATLLFLNKSFSIKNEKIGFGVAGALGGFLNGCLSISGPPVVLFLANQGIEKDSFRANITFYFIVLNIIAIMTYLQNGLLNTVIFEKVLYFIPAMFLGGFVGIKISKKLNEKLFRKIALLLLILSGVWTIAGTF